MMEKYQAFLHKWIKFELPLPRSRAWWLNYLVYP